MKKIILILLCLVMLCGVVSCDNSSDIALNKNGDKVIQEETDDISGDNISVRAILERLATARCSLDDFKQKFPDYRFVNDNIYGCVLKVKSLPNTYFSFKKLNGENGFSKYILESISAPADILLPEFLNLSFNEIESKFEDSFTSSTLDFVDVPTSNLYLYKETYFYEIRASIHGEKLTREAVFIYPYSDTYLPIETIDVSMQINLSNIDENLLQDLVSKRISLDDFSELFTQNHLRTAGNCIFISVDEFHGVEFCFKSLVDSIHGRSVYVLHSVIGDASVLLPKYVGQDFFYLNQETGIFEFIHNSLDIVSYEENCSYKINYDDWKEYNKLESNIKVTLLSYTDTWVRPW